jgi:hypothetical protein
MASNNYSFVSIMTPSTNSTGMISFLLETVPYSVTPVIEGSTQPDPVSLTVNVCDINLTMDEVDISNLIASRFAAEIVTADIAYDGVPFFPNEQIVAKFQVTQTEHITEIWSQAKFKVKLVSNTTGVKLDISDDTGIFLTLAEGKSYAINIGYTFKGPGGSCLPDDQIIRQLKLACADIVLYLRNFVVMSTYINTFRGFDTMGVKLKPKPIIDFDSPRVRKKYLFDYLTSPVSGDGFIPSSGKYIYALNNDTGSLTFRYDETLVADNSPFGKDNQILISFIAGYSFIPEAIKKAVVSLSRVTVDPRSMDIAELKGGSGSIKWFNTNQSGFVSVFSSIKGFKA